MTWGRIGLWVVGILLLPLSHLWAGGGPQNLFLIVNARSWASRTLANHYAQQRHLDDNHLWLVDWDDSRDPLPVADFRQRLLLPLFATLAERGLSDQIDYLVYSSDFPTTIDMSADFKDEKLPPERAAYASLTGATYLAPFTLAQPNFVSGLNANQYMRGNSIRTTAVATQGFRSSYGWGKNGERLIAGGFHYYLSTMLGVTSGRGNSIDEAVEVLVRSAAADGTRPSGTIYFMQNSDIRSSVRDRDFPRAVDELKQLGVRASILPGIVPAGHHDILGAMIGTREFSWRSAGTRILPGAICEHFTSFGGKLYEDAPQTPMTEHLRYGAAGTSGTVVEPYCIQEKFPIPAMHVHYARGCTLAEAYYQSVFAPYQLLILGDPLCRPFAQPIPLELEGPEETATLSGEVRFRVKPQLPTGRTIEHYEYSLDGRRFVQNPKPECQIDTRQLVNGYHVLEIVAVEAGPLELPSSIRREMWIQNQADSVEILRPETDTLRMGQPLEIKVHSAGAKAIVVTQQGKVLGKVAGEAGTVSFATAKLGLGPIRLQATRLDDQLRPKALSRPLQITIEPPLLPPGHEAPGEKTQPGLLLTLASGETSVIDQTRDPNFLAAAGVKANEPFTLRGEFRIASDELSQFIVAHVGRLKIVVDQQLLYEVDSKRSRTFYVPLAVGKGAHDIEITGNLTDIQSLRLAFGNRGTRPLDAKTFSHRMAP